LRAASEKQDALCQVRFYLGPDHLELLHSGRGEAMDSVTIQYTFRLSPGDIIRSWIAWCVDPHAYDRDAAMILYSSEVLDGLLGKSSKNSRIESLYVALTARGKWRVGCS